MSQSYEQFFKKAKKNNQHQAEPVSLKKSQSSHSTPHSKLRAKKAPGKFPVLQFCLFGICGLALFLSVENFDQIETYISKVEIGLQTAQAEPSNPVKTETIPTSEVMPNQAVVEEKKMPDDTDYLFKLSERKKELDAREEELNKKEQEIAKQKVEIEGKLTQLEEYRVKISAMLQDRIVADSSKVDTLVQVYSNMKPLQAAKVFETMDEDLVIDILSRMKKKNAADIMNLIKAEKAQIFAERYAGYRMPASSQSKQTAPSEDEAVKP
jgi:flagellar motility protein MotE (MotC chaperone)